MKAHRLGPLLIVLAPLTIVACGRRAASAPSPLPAAGSAVSGPSIAAVLPESGSTGGSTPLKITGAGFLPGAAVVIDGIPLDATVADEATIYAVTGTHLAGTVDLVVINPDAQAARLAGGYRYVPAASFDFTGEWTGTAGPNHEYGLRFDVQDDVLVSVACGTSGAVSFLPAPGVHEGQFSIVTDGAVGISARIVSASDAVGTINIPPCRGMNWMATRRARTP